VRPTFCLVAAASAAVLAGCSGSPDTEAGRLCSAGQVKARDASITTVASAHYGPEVKGQPRDPRFAGYGDADRLAVCLAKGGSVYAVMERDHRRFLLWEQDTDNRLTPPI
jgi:hypothetical protein